MNPSWSVTALYLKRAALAGDLQPTMRRDKTFAYDLIVRYGRVSSRVALLLRSTERKPCFALFCDLHQKTPITRSAFLICEGSKKEKDLGLGGIIYSSHYRCSC